jgi:hypothetical protein
MKISGKSSRILKETVVCFKVKSQYRFVLGMPE